MSGQEGGGPFTDMESWRSECLNRRGAGQLRREACDRLKRGLVRGLLVVIALVALRVALKPLVK